jgi:hypothetical protein
MSKQLIRFKISGVTLYWVGLVYILMSRNSLLITTVSNGILAIANRIMICDFISLFIVLIILFVSYILPIITFEINVCVEK